MKGRTLLLLLALVSGTIGMAGWAVAQDAEKKMDPAMEAWLKYAAPGEHHKHLAALVGGWDATTKFRPVPGAPVQESAGSAEHSWVLGGRFVRVTYQSTMMGEPFSGRGYVGYDNYKQKYVEVWMDTMGTMMMTALGNCEGSGTVRTMLFEFDDPTSGKKGTMKSVYRFLNPDKYVLEMYGTGPDGKEFKSMEIVHTRR